MADEQPKVEQTTEPTVSNETTEKEQPKQETETPVNKFSEEQVNEIVKSRLAKDRASTYSKLGVEDLETAIQAVKLQKEADEKSKIQKGEFEKILKEKSEESQKTINSLQSELRDIKVNKSLLSSASRNKAINPDQVVELLNKNIDRPGWISWSCWWLLCSYFNKWFIIKDILTVSLRSLINIPHTPSLSFLPNPPWIDLEKIKYNDNIFSCIYKRMQQDIYYECVYSLQYQRGVGHG